MVGIQMVPQALEHRGLAGADFAGEQDKSLAALHAVNQIRQRFFMLRTAIKERRIRAEIERIGNQTEKRLIHEPEDSSVACVRVIDKYTAKNMREVRYLTPNGIGVRRCLPHLPWHEGLTAWLRELDEYRGIYLSSGYEYPGRYSRWDIVSVRPPLELVSFQREFGSGL